MRRLKLGPLSSTFCKGQGLVKVYIAFDTATKHSCIHGGIASGKITLALARYPAPRVRLKARKKVVRVEA